MLGYYLGGHLVQLCTEATIDENLWVVRKSIIGCPTTFDTLLGANRSGNCTQDFGPARQRWLRVISADDCVSRMSIITFITFASIEVAIILIAVELRR